MFDFSNYWNKLKYYDNLSKFVVGKIKDETGSVVIEEFVELKPKKFSFLVDENSKHKKEKGVKKNIVATTNRN